MKKTNNFFYGKVIAVGIDPMSAVIEFDFKNGKDVIIVDIENLETTKKIACHLCEEIFFETEIIFNYEEIERVIIKNFIGVKKYV